MYSIASQKYIYKKAIPCLLILRLSHKILRSLSTLRCLPVYILIGDLDITSLAMDATEEVSQKFASTDGRHTSEH
jgi:hypothetical protein